MHCRKYLGNFDCAGKAGFGQFFLKFIDDFNPLLATFGNTFSQATTLTPDSFKKKYKNYSVLDLC